MSINWKALTLACAGFVLLSGSVWASASGVRLLINNVPFSGDAFKLRIEEGTAMVSLRSIVEQLQGKVDFKDGTIYVTMPDSANLSKQVTSLENALRAETPEGAVRTWIRGVQQRSGAMQYAVMSPALREQTQRQFEEHFWVTGVSSPHMGQVEQLRTEEITPDQVNITFDYPLVAANETMGTGRASLTVDKLPAQNWVISNIALKDPGDTGIMIGAKKR